jgi:hypothetical protein
MNNQRTYELTYKIKKSTGFQGKGWEIVDKQNSLGGCTGGDITIEEMLFKDSNKLNLKRMAGISINEPLYRIEITAKETRKIGSRMATITFNELSHNRFDETMTYKNKQGSPKKGTKNYLSQEGTISFQKQVFENKEVLEKHFMEGYLDFKSPLQYLKIKVVR